MQIRILFSFFIFFIFSLFILPTSANAFTTRTGQDTVINKNEIINDTLLITGQHIRIDGEVRGDVICAGQSVEITNKVDGDVLCAAQTINITAPVGGSVRAVTQTVTLTNSVGRNVTVFGQNINSNANINGEMFILGQALSVGGSISGDLQTAVQSATITGSIGRNVNVTAENVRIANTAKINGNLTYASEHATVSSRGVAGKVYRQPMRKENHTNTIRRAFLGISQIASILIHILVALVIITIWRKSLIRATDTMAEYFSKSLGIGLVLLICIPIIFVVFFVTIIGIPIALLLGMLFAFALFLSRILVAIVLGRYITKNYWVSKRDSLMWSSVLGVIVAWLLYHIPVVGWLITFVAVLWGLGGLSYWLRPLSGENRRTEEIPLPSSHSLNSQRPVRKSSTKTNRK